MSIVGVFILVMVCYTIYGLLTDAQDDAIGLLKKAYKALEKESEKVEKIHNGFHWKKDLSSGDAKSIDIYITVEEKKDMDKAFWRTNDKEKYGLYFRFIYELTEEVCEDIIGDETMKSYVGHLNSFARLCDPLKVTPYITEITQEDDQVIIHNTNMDDFKNIWENYFDLNKEYVPLKVELSMDDLLKQAIEFGYGIRLLNQDPFEMVISLIISARNSIPSIMKTIKKISEKFGDKIEYKGEVYHAFPTPEQLKKATLEDIQETGASFRSKYIIDTILNINRALEAKKSGKLTDELKMYDLEYIMSLPTDECHIALQAFKGVGAKVADCIMLFSMGKKSAFPVDVWIKRAMIHFYVAPDVSLNKIRVIGREKYGELSGLAQQYLFYYAREFGIGR